jgi:hypothetical protein
MPIWVLAAERAYVAAAVGRAPGPPDLRQDAARAAASGPPDLQAHAIAAAGAVASRYLAVSTPRSFGIVIDAIPDVEAAGLALAAHLTWFAPSDIRCAATGTGAAELATATSGRVVAIDEALACDIVHIHSTRVRVTPAQLRRGTHVNAVSAEVVDAELLALATVVREAGLPAVAAGLVDGRQLDEITIFCIDGAPIAMAATSILWRGFQ